MPKSQKDKLHRIYIDTISCPVITFESGFPRYLAVYIEKATRVFKGLKKAGVVTGISKYSLVRIIPRMV